MDDMKKFVIPEMGHTMGNLICSYILTNTDVIYTGYQVDHNKNLIINIQTSNGLLPDVCFEGAVKKCQNDIKNLTAELVSNSSK